MTAASTTGAPIGVILAGGEAARMGGTPKGLASVGGLRIVDRVARALRPVTDGLLVVSGRPDAVGWIQGATVRRDERPGLGPIGGIVTALRTTSRDVLVVGWDMPFVTTALLAPLLHADEFAPIVLWRCGQRLEPLCALYRPPALPALDAAIAAGRREVGAVAVSCGARVLPADDPAPFCNVNTPDELARAERLAGAKGRRSPLEAA